MRKVTTRRTSLPKARSDGPHTGTAFVVERDESRTGYRFPSEWKDV